MIWREKKTGVLLSSICSLFTPDQTFAVFQKMARSQSNGETKAKGRGFEKKTENEQLIPQQWTLHRSFPPSKGPRFRGLPRIFRSFSGPIQDSLPSLKARKPEKEERKERREIGIGQTLKSALLLFGSPFSCKLEDQIFFKRKFARSHVLPGFARKSGGWD